ncbi:recombinase RecT [Acinetobacter proteolyticus]|uniref:recombinase RecT n=1 Tax=Acinetobacter proteolyticus TaxID=1776741 RepID=UPI0008635048|nr:recombinase RecT [Acinetobacter proteolyticus]OEY96075.1 recombinase RecT [Acinetobacter proteolyticus]
MNAQLQTTHTNSVGFLNVESFEFSQRVANMLSNSTLVPEDYRAVKKVKAGKDNNGVMQYRDEPNPNGLSNCIIALNMANRMGADTLMIMQNLYLIEGRPSWSSQFILGSINSSGRFSPLRYEIENRGEKEVSYQETIWANGRKSTVTKTIKIHDVSCVAWATEQGVTVPNFSLEDLKKYGGVFKCCKAYGIPVLESSKISIEMAVKEGWYSKNGSKWQTMPEQMLRYRAASFFGRVYAPEILMGLRSVEEEQDMIDVTPEPEVKNTAGQVRALKQKILAAKTTSDLYALGGELADLDDADKSEIQKLFTAQLEKLSVEVVVENVADAEVLENETSAPVEEQKQPQELVNRRQPKDVEKVSSMAIRKEYLVRMNKAETLDELTNIHDEFLKNEGLTGQHVSYLKDTYMQLKEKLKPAAEVQETKVEPVDPIKSNSVKSGLERMIAEAKDIISLEAEVARAISGNESKMTLAHHQAVLVTYAQRKEILAQQDIFDDAPVNPVDATIQKIKAAKSQDEINTIFADPALEKFSDDDMALLNQAADMREAELQG